jgi:hypothetical protein
MQGEHAELQGGRELNFITNKDAYAGSLLTRIISAVNTLAKNAGVAAVGKVSPPPPVNRINVQGTLSGDTVTCPSEVLHWTLDHNQAIAKGVNYFSEIDTDPSFPAPHVYDHGSSRSAFLTLPSHDNNNVQHTFYLRSYAQMPGSDPSAPTVHGNLGAPLKIKMTGTSKTSLLTSAGSGTASPNGQQGGHGLGKVLDRPAPGPKRNVS